MLSDKDQQNVAAFIFGCGHANVRFKDNLVIYRDQTRGFFAQDKVMDTAPILEVVKGKSLAQIEKMLFVAEVNQTMSEAPSDEEERPNDIQTMLDAVTLPYPFATFIYPLGANFHD